MLQDRIEISLVTVIYIALNPTIPASTPINQVIGL